MIRFANEYESTRDLKIAVWSYSIPELPSDGKPALVLEFIGGQTVKESLRSRR